MRILVIDDDGLSRAKMERLISSLGYEVVMAEDGLEGEEWQSERPDS